MPTVEPAGPTEPASVPVPASTPPPSAAAAVETPAGNPYQKGDKVTTKCKGADVEAEVTTAFKDEVQVRTTGRRTAVGDGAEGAADNGVTRSNGADGYNQASHAPQK